MILVGREGEGKSSGLTTNWDPILRSPVSRNCMYGMPASLGAGSGLKTYHTSGCWSLWSPLAGLLIIC